MVKLNISDIIEEFILEQFDDTNNVSLSRNELANYFNCAPSQINYVLSTRFTTPRGFLIESRRGGGGYIRLSKLNLNKNDYVNNLLCNVLNNEIDYPTSIQILKQLIQLNILDETTSRVLGYALSPKALAMPIKIENKQRANILKNVLINIVKG